MRKFEKNTAILMLILFTYFTLVKAQTPVNDPAWNFQSAKSDDFNYPLNSTLWWDPDDAHGWGAEYLYQSNVIQSPGNTTIKLKTDTLIPGKHVYNSGWANPSGPGVTYVYQNAALITKKAGSPLKDLYHFGYLEASIKFPTGCYSLWPAFWLWSQSCDDSYYNEIDICENPAYESYHGNFMGTNIHVHNYYCDIDSTYDRGRTIDVVVNISNDFHTYAVEWYPDRIIWYFDGTVVRRLIDATGNHIPQYPMAAIFNLAVDPYQAWLPANWNTFTHGDATPTCYPKYMEIDYMYYYVLKNDCGTDFTNLCIPSDYDRKIKKSIATDASCTPTYNPSTFAASYTLRATDHVTLNQGITINPSGSGYFAIDILPCPQ